MNTETSTSNNFKSVIRTKSPIKAWYLIHFCGQRVRSTRTTPIVTLLGVMIYSKAWILVG